MSRLYIGDKNLDFAFIVKKNIERFRIFSQVAETKQLLPLQNRSFMVTEVENSPSETLWVLSFDHRTNNWDGFSCIQDTLPFVDLMRCQVQLQHKNLYIWSKGYQQSIHDHEGSTQEGVRTIKNVQLQHFWIFVHHPKCRTHTITDRNSSWNNSKPYTFSHLNSYNNFSYSKTNPFPDCSTPKWAW